MISATPNATDVDPFFGERNGREVRGQAPAGSAVASATMERPGVSGRRRPAPPAQPGPARRRKQWGGDRRTRALPMVPPPVGDRRVAMARLAIVVTVTAWLGYLTMWFFEDFFHPGYETAVDRAESVLYLLIATLPTVSALAYLLSRLGFFYRTRTHHRASRAILDQFFDTTTPTLTTIIPSYQEDVRVIRNTVLSAALQEYPDKRVVLLIDDPFVPRTAQAREQLEAARALPQEIGRLLAWPASRFTRALQVFEASCERQEPLGSGSMIALASNHDEAAVWLERLAADQEIIDHTDVFFAHEVVLRLAASLRAISAALLASADEGVVLEQQMFRRLYRRLAWTFRAEVTSFERKRYVSLSHEPNKAMNLNSYIGLMGGSYREVQTVTGTALVRAKPGGRTLNIPDPDYVVTLDADSVLLPEYCLRLVHLLEQSEYRDMAIAQTPYSAFPGSSTRLERIAGATTDLQHIVHQGLTYYDATFWVGANAVIRKRALDEIAETAYIGDWEIRHYIKDRTRHRGHRVDHRHGRARLAAVQLPGAAELQRDAAGLRVAVHPAATVGQRRPADPAQAAPSVPGPAGARAANPVRRAVPALELHGVDLVWSSVSLLILLAFPFSATLISPLLGLVALPYFTGHGQRSALLRLQAARRVPHLRLQPGAAAGEPGRDPVLAGAGDHGVEGAFVRTPKVRNRTVVPPFFVVAPYLLIALAGYTCYFDYRHHRLGNMAYAALYVVLACYAAKAFIGLRNSVVDVWIHATSLLYKPTSRCCRLPRKARAQPESAGGQRRRLSLLRVLVALAVLAGAVFGGFFGVMARLANTTVVHQTWFAPYVDVTLRRRRRRRRSFRALRPTRPGRLCSVS